MNPGPAISAVATPVRSALPDDLGGDVARIAAQALGEGHDAVGLVVAALRCPQHRISACF